jgi:Fur family zinc uptake transcriptional regulator
MTVDLSPNEKVILNVLKKSNKPLKAYRILFQVQKKGIKSPTQVYRALDKLQEIGKVHKIESRNSYVICTNTDCLNKSSVSFLICNLCEKIVEIEDKVISDRFSEICKKFNRKYSQHKLEILGTCTSCSDQK